MFSSTIIADSKSEFGHRLTSFLITFPRYILAEFNTHRMFGRNSASSRAIPFNKMVKNVEENPFVPMKWMIDHKGMQGTKYVEDEACAQIRKDQWLHSRDAAVANAKMLHRSIDEMGVHPDNDNYEPITKQVCNRLLEPFMWHTVICTATEYQNYFALRANDAAEIHMQKLAYLMLDNYNEVQPLFLREQKWHTPFIAEEDHLDFVDGIACKVSVARCARTSYTVVGEPDKKHMQTEDVELHDRLLAQGHMSPFENVATAMTEEEYHDHTKSIVVSEDYMEEYVAQNRFFQYHIKGKNSVGDYRVTEYGWSGHLRGFIPYRKTIPNENRTDPRVQTLWRNKM